VGAGGDQMALHLADPASGQHIGDLTFHLDIVRDQPPVLLQQQQRAGAARMRACAANKLCAPCMHVSAQLQQHPL
jgi:hypothetical protein